MSWQERAEKAEKELAEAQATLAKLREREAKQKPVAMVDAGDDGYFAEILPDCSVSVGDILYAFPPLHIDPKFWKQSFDQWWNAHGQYLRAGGGQYEKTFGYHAWEAAAALYTAPVPEQREGKLAVSKCAGCNGHGMLGNGHPDCGDVMCHFCGGTGVDSAPAMAAPAVPEDVIEDHRRLVRELDVLINGEDGAAAQASLCDIVAQVAKEGLVSGRKMPAVPGELLKCWLIERPASSEWPAIWLTITTDGRRWVSDGGTMYSTGGARYFTSAASEALKFADKESADEYVRHNKIKDVVVTEHIFDNRSLLQSAPQPEMLAPNTSKIGISHLLDEAETVAGQESKQNNNAGAETIAPQSDKEV